MLPWTVNQLAERGFNPLPLEDAANRCFNAVGPSCVRGGLYSSDETTQRFWDAFSAASKLLRGGEEERMAA